MTKKETHVNAPEVNRPDMTIDDTTCRDVNARVTCSLSNTNRAHKKYFIDQGANGGISRDDVRIMS